MSTSIIINRTKAIFTPARVIDLVAVLYIMLFAYTAVAKFTDFNRFLTTLTLSPLVKEYATLIAYTIPILELLIVVLLAIERPIGKTPIRKIGLIAGAILMFSFSVYIVLMFALYGNKLPCSCGGIMSALSWGEHLVVNMLFVTLAIWAVRLYKPKPE